MWKLFGSDLTGGFWLLQRMLLQVSHASPKDVLRLFRGEKRFKDHCRKISQFAALKM